MNDPIRLLHSGASIGYVPAERRIDSPPKSSRVKKSQVPAWTWIEEISLRHPVCDNSGWLSSVGAERPAKLGSEKIVIWQAPPCANAGGGGRDAAWAGGGPTCGQYWTHCGSAPPSSKSTMRQCNWQPSGVNPVQAGPAME